MYVGLPVYLRGVDCRVRVFRQPRGVAHSLALVERRGLRALRHVIGPQALSLLPHRRRPGNLAEAGLDAG